MAEEKENRVLPKAIDEKTFKELNDILTSLKFGSVTLVIQDGKVVQLEKNEKFRMV
jgi:hypothetical protein